MSSTTDPRRLPALAIVLVVLALVVAVVLAAGADWTDEDKLSAAQGLPDLGQELAAQEWRLDPAASSMVSGSDDAVTLAFADDHVFGAGPCNDYRGVLELDDDGDTLTITQLRRETDRSCDENVTQAEDEYVAALLSVRHVDLPEGYDQDRLELTGDRGARLVFDAAPSKP